MQSPIAALLIIVLIFLSLFVLFLELVLRRIIRESNGSRVSLTNGPNGANVSYTQAWIDSGSYPFDYLTEEVWNEMRSFHNERGLQTRTLVGGDFGVKLGVKPVAKLRGFQINRFISIQSPNFSISSGVRNTTDTLYSAKSNKVFLFGGSTVFCDEMPDRFTLASFLQRVINKVSLDTAVVNCGWPGASIIDRTKMLKESVRLQSGDTTVFYIGDNDSGWVYVPKAEPNKGLLSEELIPLPIRSLKFLKNKFDLEIAGWVYNEIAPRWMRKYSEFAVGATIDALKDANEYCRSREVEMLVILQPNLYTLRTKHPSEAQAEKRFSNNLKTVILHAYKHYEEWVKETPYAVSATHIFDNAPAPVFLDWAHVNARGNEIIAKFIFEELQRREMLSSDSKL